MAPGLPMPAALTKGVLLSVADYTEKELTVTAGADGTATVSTDQLQQGQIMRVERITFTSPSLNEVEVGIYTGDGSILVQRRRDFAQVPPGNVAVAEYPSYLTITPTSCLTIYVTGANQGDVFTAAVQYQLVLKVFGQQGNS